MDLHKVNTLTNDLDFIWTWIHLKTTNLSLFVVHGQCGKWVWSTVHEHIIDDEPVRLSKLSKFCQFWRRQWRPIHQIKTHQEKQNLPEPSPELLQSRPGCSCLCRPPQWWLLQRGKISIIYPFKSFWLLNNTCDNGLNILSTLLYFTFQKHFCVGKHSFTKILFPPPQQAFSFFLFVNLCVLMPE